MFKYLPMSSAPCAYVVSVGDAHHRARARFYGIVTACMLPHQSFALHECVIQDGARNTVTMTADEVDELRRRPYTVASTHSRRTRSGQAGATLLASVEVGMTIAKLRLHDRIIVFCDCPTLRTELEHLGVLVASPAACDRHDLWWRLREAAMLDAATSIRVEQIIMPISETDPVPVHTPAAPTAPTALAAPPPPNPLETVAPAISASPVPPTADLMPPDAPKVAPAPELPAPIPAPLSVPPEPMQETLPTPAEPVSEQLPTVAEPTPEPLPPAAEQAPEPAPEPTPDPSSVEEALVETAQT